MCWTYGLHCLHPAKNKRFHTGLFPSKREKRIQVGGKDQSTHCPLQFDGVKRIVKNSSYLYVGSKLSIPSAEMIFSRSSLFGSFGESIINKVRIQFITSFQTSF